MAGENEYTPIFIPWFVTSEYQRPVPDGFELTVEEEEYKKEYDLSDEQMYWRRLKIGEGGERKFRQEYPACAEEAFLVSGHNVFNQEKVAQLVATDPTAERAYNPLSSDFVDTKEGELQIWDYPQWDDAYIVAADVAQGVGQDYSCAIVLDTNRRIVAMYRNNRIDPTEYGEMLFYLGRYYNNALLCVESNSIGVATLARLDQMRYVNLYYQTKVADLSNEESTRVGFRTTQSSKPHIIGQLQNAIEEDDIWVPSKTIISEMRTYVSDDNGKLTALQGCHDDTIMACAMALEVYRTHIDKLTTNKVSWRDRVGNYQEDSTEWL